MSLEPLRQFVCTVVDPSVEAWDAFSTLFSSVELEKYAYFAQAGEVAQKIAFLQTGVVRAFFRNADGTEYNKTFFTEGVLFGAYSSLITGQPNLIHHQALTKCVMWEASFAELRALYDRFPVWERFARMLAESFFVVKEKREIELVMLDAAGRYEVFKTDHPGLENRIPLYHIASYLGISPTQLSRIRGRR
ncbi:MAG: Crp/Fnr family transcriptional regulator [Bacteroidota bacterium]